MSTTKEEIRKILGGDKAGIIDTDYFAHEAGKIRRDGGAPFPAAKTASSFGTKHVKRYASKEILFDAGTDGFTIESMFDDICKLKEPADMAFGTLCALRFECGMGAYLKLIKYRDIISMNVTSDMKNMEIKVWKA